MSQAHKPHLPNNDVPDGFEPGAPPVEPDEGPTPEPIPQDPEHDRVVDPAARQTRLPLPMAQPVGVTRCP